MAKRTTIFYATDVHGSEVTFRKFVNAGKIYGADVLILGGDLTGKMVVALIEQPDKTYMGKLYGNVYTAKTEEELEKIEKQIQSSGYYPYRTTRDEVEEMRKNEAKLDSVFKRCMLETLGKWMGLAEERLRGMGIKIYVTGGNDDIPEISDVLRAHESDVIIVPEEKVVFIDDRHEMASTGYGNVTPWHCPRDIPEVELAKIIERMMPDIKDMDNAIFNFHVPPRGTPIDLAPELDENLKPKLEMGKGFKMTSVGSTAVRNAILKHQPLLGLHGHIHESKGEVRLGRSLCINPGSEYGEGILRGVLIVLSDKKAKVDSCVFTQG